MTTQQMAERIIDLVERDKCLTFAQLMHDFGEEARGHMAMEVLPNLFIWAGVSQTFLDAVNLTHSRLELVGVPPLYYLMDGALLQMPIARRERAYKKDHWLPVGLIKRKTPLKAAPEVTPRVAGVRPPKH